MASSPTLVRRTQAERSTATKQRLIDAAIACLIEDGYAHTTTVEVCERAELTRGALHHHFSSLAGLLIEVLQQVYERLRALSAATGNEEVGLETLIREGWTRARQPEFKAVIEIWLAARNDPDLGKELQPAIARLSRLFSAEHNPKLAKLLSSKSELVTLYRVAFEAMIGLALGRATSPGGAPVEHENDVIEMLASLARQSES